MTLPRSIRLTIVIILAALAGASLFACNRSKGAPNTNANANSTAVVIEVSTSAAVSRQLPRFFEATGGLAPNQQTDVAAETSGKGAAGGGGPGGFFENGEEVGER